MADFKTHEETARTITLTWTPPAGQEGFLPMIDDKDKLKDGKRHPSTSESLGSIVIGKPDDETNPATKHTYSVQCFDPKWTKFTFDPVTKPPVPPEPPVPPIPPSTGGIIWDGRATKMTSLPQPDGASGVNPVPSNIWPTCAYIHNDITLANDNRFGRVFVCRMKGGLGVKGDWLNSPASKNPWGEGWQQADSYSLELTSGGGTPYKRTIKPGEINWYAQSVRLHSGWEGANFGLVTQYGYPTLASPPFGLAFDRNGINFICLPGMLVNGTTGWWDRHVIGPWESIVSHWYDVVFGVMWDWDPLDKSTTHPVGKGWYEGWTRCKDLGETSFTKRFSKQNCGTFQYQQGQSWTDIMDKNGMYCGTGTAKPESWTISCDLRGLSFHATRADAEASLA